MRVGFQVELPSPCIDIKLIRLRSIHTIESVVKIGQTDHYLVGLDSIDQQLGRLGALEGCVVLLEPERGVFVVGRGLGVSDLFGVGLARRTVLALGELRSVLSDVVAGGAAAAVPDRRGELHLGVVTAIGREVSEGRDIDCDWGFLEVLGVGCKVGL